MNILEYIPTGQKNAISRKHLSMMTGLSDRICRRLIQQARESGAKIVSSSHCAGYWIASTDEEWAIFCREQASRIASIAKILRAHPELEGQVRI